jgi:hypothetical protein
MFAEGTEWKMSWLERVLPNIVAITSHPGHPGPTKRRGSVERPVRDAKKRPSIDRGFWSANARGVGDDGSRSLSC